MNLFSLQSIGQTDNSLFFQFALCIDLFNENKSVFMVSDTFFVQILTVFKAVF